MMEMPLQYQDGGDVYWNDGERRDTHFAHTKVVVQLDFVWVGAAPEFDLQLSQVLNNIIFITTSLSLSKSSVSMWYLGSSVWVILDYCLLINFAVILTVFYLVHFSFIQI